MKSLYKLLVFLFLANSVNAQIVNIPDANFKAYLLSSNSNNDIAKDSNDNNIAIDANSDGELEQNEVVMVYKLRILSSSIFSITGVESFENLTNLTISQMTDGGINLSNMINLTSLTINNQHNTISLTDLPALTSLNIFSNTSANCMISNLDSLISLNLSNNNNFSALSVLGCNSLNSLVPPSWVENLSLSDLPLLTTFNCFNRHVMTLTIVNTPLTNLDCSGNFIPSLDLSNLSTLVTLDCSGSYLTSLNLTGCTNLTTLDCASNQLTQLNLANFSNLSSVTLFSNNFDLIDLSGTLVSSFIYNSQNSSLVINMSNCVNLVNFTVPGQNVGSLNLSNCANLLSIYGPGTELSSNLELHGCNMLNSIYFNAIYIENLDLSYLPSLQSLRFQSNSSVKTLNLSGASNLTQLYVSCFYLEKLFLRGINNVSSTFSFANFLTSFSNLSLSYVCVDDDQIEAVHNLLASQGYTNAVVNSYCSFTPSTEYNTITGIVKMDSDNNGCEITDLPIKNLKIKNTQLSGNTHTFTNNSGIYNFYNIFAGNQQIEPLLENPSYFTVDPVSAVINFPTIDGSTFTQNFCISSNGIHNDLEVVIAPLTPARPGFDTTYEVIYKNKGNQTVSGNVSLAFDDDRTDFVSSNPNPDNLAVNSLTWNYTNLLPFENRVITLTLNVNSPTEIPAVNIGDQLDFGTTITPIINDEIPADNVFGYKQTVVGAFDPNSIECLEGEVVPTSYIGQYLHYAVNFENTGNFPAENVVVKVVIDTTKYDMNSLQLMNVSHDSYTRINGNVVEFIFENIALDSGGHGNILFKIQTVNSLINGDSVAKRADIFFDYNAPIDTGMANTTFEVLNNSIFELDNSISIYPNPTSSIININGNFNIKTIELYDVQGRLLQTQLLDEVQTSIDISEKSKGVYFLKITSDKGSKVEKLIKE